MLEFLRSYLNAIMSHCRQIRRGMGEMPQGFNPSYQEKDDSLVDFIEDLPILTNEITRPSSRFFIFREPSKPSPSVQLPKPSGNWVNKP